VIHVDVMDGSFVPPITMGPIVVQSLADTVHSAGGILDVHLMIDSPDRQIEAFAGAGADVLTVHAEAATHIDRTLRAIREAGMMAGLAICPGTPVSIFEPVVELLDLALVMSVNPGWGGQKFIEASLARIEATRSVVGPGVAIEVDGGIDTITAGPAAEAGADLLVAGSAVFGAEDPQSAYRAIAEAAAPAS
jgi:ribulose-phosphate 3-epimerase